MDRKAGGCIYIYIYIYIDWPLSNPKLYGIIYEILCEQVIFNAPVSLTESYQKCHKTSTQALLDASGIAVANTVSFMPVIAFLVVQMYVVYCVYFKKTRQPETRNGHAVEKFKREEMREITYMLASHILQVSCLLYYVICDM